MSFIKSYWWVFALLIGAFLIYWFMFRTKAVVATGPTLPPKLNPDCEYSVQQWLDKVAEIERAIDASAQWKAAVQAQVGAGKTYSNYQAARKANAIDYMEVQLMLCNPTKAPV